MNEALLRRFINEVLSGYGNKSAGKDPLSNNLRHGVPVRQRGGNVLEDERIEDEQIEQSRAGLQAATCLIIADDGKVLAVSRKDDPTDFGLPGGKVDEGETPEQAGARELKEETGLDAVKLSKVFVRNDADGFTTTTFACEPSGEINTPEEGIVRWVEPEVLFKGSFGRYNIELFRRLGRL